MWQTTAPDGNLLFLRREGGGWRATYLGLNAEGSTAQEAIRKALGVVDEPGGAELEAWIAAHVAELDAEPGDDLTRCDTR